MVSKSSGYSVANPTANAMSPLLPRDIVLVILDGLIGDMRALKACSLVCRRWLATARAYLFRQIHIYIDHKYSRSQISFLRANPAILGCVTSLVITLPDMRKRQSNSLNSNYDNSGFEQIATLYPMLHSIVHLHTVLSYGCLSVVEFGLSIMPILSKLRSLGFSGSSDWSFTDLIPILGHAINIEELNMHASLLPSTHADRHEHLSCVQSTRARLRRLSASILYIAEIDQWIRSDEQLEDVRNLTLCCRYSREIDPISLKVSEISSITRALGRSLTELSITDVDTYTTRSKSPSCRILIF